MIMNKFYTLNIHFIIETLKYISVTFKPHESVAEPDVHNRRSVFFTLPYHTVPIDY